MSTSANLSTVTVTGKQATIANKLDKQTYKANQFETVKGGSATDVLRNLPSVSVNGAGEISVRGSTGFLVLIDGKPVLTDAQTILSQLPANTIENIEILTSPSAKYDADGKSGIINITTKKGTTDGLSILVNTQLGLPSTTDYANLANPLRFGADVTVNYRKNKWDVSLSANYTRNDANGRREGDVFTRNEANNSITHFPSSGERSYDRYNYGMRSAVTFMPNKYNVFTAGVFTSRRYQQRRADIVYRNSTRNLTTGNEMRSLTYFNSNLQEKEGNFSLGSLDYTRIFRDASKITAGAVYENSNLYGNTINRNLDFPAKAAVFQLVQNPYTNPINGIRLKLDYMKMFGKAKLEAGYQFRSDKQDGRFDYTVSPNTNQPDRGKFRGTAKTSNHINAAYVQFGGLAQKLQYTAGLRYENAFREVILSSDIESHILNLNNLFPSVNLLYTVSKKWSVKTGYSKRIQRNNNFELNPIPEREHSETLEQGDPDLLPQFIDLAEIGLNHSFKKGSFFTTLYYQNIKNPVQRVNSVYADTILNRLFTNVERARLIGLELGSTFKPAPWFTAYLGANIYNYRISGKVNILGATSVVDNADWVYSFNVNTTFDLGKQWSLQANVNYLAARPTAQGRDSRFYSPNTALKKTFANGKFSLSLLWQNMNLGLLNANQQRITTWGKDFYTTTNYIYETDVLLLNFSFNLNSFNSMLKLPASDLGDKEF
ncbi:MAG: TonB-dependent receptor [Bacteroidetes bacterium]|nr:MAG: TonB-dependent receptor [Bacteroidota bacterium]